jgi:hypothetical protein
MVSHTGGSDSDQSQSRRNLPLKPRFLVQNLLEMSGVVSESIKTGTAGRADLTEFTVGPDQVRVGDETITVFAMREMPDWTVREFCIVPIHFRGHKFFLKHKSPGPPPYAFRYELAPWYSALGQESNCPIHYDEEYVADRDRHSRHNRRQDHLHSALFVVYPFLGFCWSGFKERVLGPIGFEPGSITEASVMISVGFWLLEGTFVGAFHVGFLAILFSCWPLTWLDYLLVFLLPLDSAVRYGQIIAGDASPGGFLEWLFNRRKAGGQRRD